MAFVTRSERKIKNELANMTSIGPGEYENEEIKEEARLLHKISHIYTHMTKRNNLQINIPFNSTGIRNSLIKINNTPGPGTYTDVYYNAKKKNNEDIQPLNNEIIFMEENGSLIPKFKNESKGFLSSEKRFNNFSDTNNNKNVGPGCYQIGKSLNKIKIYNTRYGKMGQNIRTRVYKSLENSIPTIPDKNRGDFKIINGQIKELKKATNKGNELGPGQYNVSPKWESKAIDWNFGLKKENKSLNFQNELINSLNKKNYLELQMNMDKTSLSSLNKSQKKNIKKNLSNNNISEEKQNQNNSIKNMVFRRFVKDRKKVHDMSLKKIKQYNDMILDIKYNDTPGPGYYHNESKILKSPISIFNTNKSQNFGSNTPQFFKINTDNVLIGPGSYFHEKNKYEPKFETIIHTKKPERKDSENKKEIGIYLNNFRKNNIKKQPDVGQYDLEKDFIKKEISNVKSFGILSERFKSNRSTDEKEIEEYDKGEKEEKNDLEKNKNNSIINNRYEDRLKIKIDSKYIELKKEEEKKEKEKRDKYRDIKLPPVGAYSPEIITSMSYNVLSKVNPYRNKIAPFNIINTRFKDKLNIQKKSMELPGPGKYEVSDAYNALYNSKKNYNIFGAGLQRKNIRNNMPGPGVYDVNDPNSSWNKKTFNILFLEKENSL